MTGWPLDGRWRPGSPLAGRFESSIQRVRVVTISDPPPPPFGYLYLNNDATYSSHVARTTYHGPWDRALKISETLAERCSRGGVGDG